MVPLNFRTLSMVPLIFFDYQRYPCVIESFTTVTFSSFFRPKLFKTVNFFFFFFYFSKQNKNKGKSKKLTVLDGKIRKG